MTLAALIFTVITAGAALRTVRLAADSARSGSRAAEASERAVRQAHLEAKNRHYQEMVFLVQQLHTFKGTGRTVGHPDWYVPRNRLQVLTFGIDEDIPQTQQILLCTMAAAAPTEAAQIELLEVIERTQNLLYSDPRAEEWQKITDQAVSRAKRRPRFPWSLRRAAGI